MHKADVIKRQTLLFQIARCCRCCVFPTRGHAHFYKPFKSHSINVPTVASICNNAASKCFKNTAKRYKRHSHSSRRGGGREEGGVGGGSDSTTLLLTDTQRSRTQPPRRLSGPTHRTESDFFISSALQSSAEGLCRRGPSTTLERLLIFAARPPQDYNVLTSGNNVEPAFCTFGNVGKKKKCLTSTLRQTLHI